MTKNLETADRIAKLALSLLTLVLYFFGVIRGPLAVTLIVLSIIVILLYLIRLAAVRGDG
jgi:hypothetical protein